MRVGVVAPLAVMVIANVAAALTVAPLVPMHEIVAGPPTVATADAVNVITEVPPA